MMQTESIIRLIGRRSSHFTRVAAIFAEELGLTYTLHVAGDLTRNDAESYGGNPSLKVPTLHVGNSVIFGTENICRKLVECAARSGDPRIVLAEQVHDDLVRCAQELVWYTMTAQVQLRVGVQVCKLPADNLFFVKARSGMEGALAWLESRLDRLLRQLPVVRQFSLLEVTMFCMYEHLMFLPSVPLDSYSRLRGFATAFAVRDSARRTPFMFDPLPIATTHVR